MMPGLRWRGWNEYLQIMEVLPGTTPSMIDRFLAERNVSPTTARIWAEQEQLFTFRGCLCKRDS